MRQATLKLKTSIQNAGNNINITNNALEINRIMLNAMLFVLAGLALWYVLILGNMVFDIVQRKTLEKEAQALSNEVGQLELSYLSASGNMDIAMSAELGLKEIKPTYATRKSLGSLTLGNNEI
jgi:hypothetical protein